MHNAICDLESSDESIIPRLLQHTHDILHDLHPLWARPMPKSSIVCHSLIEQRASGLLEPGEHRSMIAGPFAVTFGGRRRLADHDKCRKHDFELFCAIYQMDTIFGLGKPVSHSLKGKMGDQAVPFTATI
jgi:hypothetical protein